MNINLNKIKKLIGTNAANVISNALCVSDYVIERVYSFKLLGVVIEHNLKWNAHVDSICTKTSMRLHYLKVLKRSSLSRDDLLYFCSSVIRPVLEYACPAWHTSLTQQQTRQIESIHKRALRIIFNTLCLQKNPCDYVFDDNLNSKRPIVIIFGTVIT